MDTLGDTREGTEDYTHTRPKDLEIQTFPKGKKLWVVTRIPHEVREKSYLVSRNVSHGDPLPPLNGPSLIRSRSSHPPRAPPLLFRRQVLAWTSVRGPTPGPTTRAQPGVLGGRVPRVGRGSGRRGRDVPRSFQDLIPSRWEPWHRGVWKDPRSKGGRCNQSHTHGPRTF